MINSALIAFTIWSTSEAEARQIIAVHVLDKLGQPVVGAHVTYQVFGYGPGGSRPSWPTIRGVPVSTNDQGVALIRSRRIRYDVLVDVSKDGYQTVSAELGMQYDEYWANRDLRVHVGKILNAAYGDVPSPDPVSFILYLPPVSDAPQGLRFKQITFGLSRSSPYRYFSFTSGFLREDPAEGDIQFEFVNNPTGNRPTLKMTGLHGAGILQVPFKFVPDNGEKSYEQMMLMAPLSGYQESTVLDNFSLPGPVFYFRNADGSLYARFNVDGYPNKDLSGTVQFTVWVNPTASRLLMFDPALELKWPPWLPH